MKLHTFKGGLKLASQKDISLRNPIRKMPLPGRLLFSLTARAGHRYDPVICNGDSVTRGQVLATSVGARLPPILASASGTITVEKNTRLILVTAVQTEDDPISVQTQTGINQQLHAGGIVGLGGAAFPASIKLESILDCAPEFLIINAAECEPMISCDQALMREHAEEIVEGIHLLLEHTQATRCLIGIEDNKPAEAAQLKQALDKKADTRIALVQVPTLYPTGGERQLIRVLTGRSVHWQQLPRDAGVVCFNIATALAVKRLIINREPLLRRIVTVTGDAVSQPGNFDVLFGTPISDVIRFVESDLVNTSKTTETLTDNLSLTVGGPMTGTTTTDIDQPVTAAINCLIIKKRQGATPVRPCIRCGDCDDVCPAALLPQQLHWYCHSENYVNAQKFKLGACIECGCCDHVCPSGLPLTASFVAAKGAIEEQRRSSVLAEQAKIRFDNRQVRLENREKLKQERLAARKNSRDSIQATLARTRARRQRKDAPG